MITRGQLSIKHYNLLLMSVIPTHVFQSKYLTWAYGRLKWHQKRRMDSIIFTCYYTGWALSTHEHHSLPAEHSPYHQGLCYPETCAYPDVLKPKSSATVFGWWQHHHHCNPTNVYKTISSTQPENNWKQGPCFESQNSGFDRNQSNGHVANHNKNEDNQQMWE